MNPMIIAAAIGGLLWLRGRHNPPAGPRPAPRRAPLAKLSDSERRQLAAARRLSLEFHGNDRHVLELDPHERAMPRFVVEAGALEEFAYNPPADSKRDDNNAIYSHESGDRGILAPKAKQKPRLAVDPRTRRPVIVPEKSPMRFDENRGFVG